jgi:hypothetical protein
MAGEQKVGIPRPLMIISAVLAIIVSLIAIVTWNGSRLQPPPCPELQQAENAMAEAGKVISKGFPRLMCRGPAESDLPMNWDSVLLNAKAAAADFSACKKNPEAEDGLTRALVVQKMASYATRLAKDPAHVPEYEDWQSIKARQGDQPQPAFVTARETERDLDRDAALWLQDRDPQRRGPCADPSRRQEWVLVDNAISLGLKVLAQDPTISRDPKLGALGCAWMFRSEQMAYQADCAQDRALRTDAAVALDRARDNGTPDGGLFEFEVELMAGAVGCPLDAGARRQLRAKVAAAFAKDEETLGDRSVADDDKSKLIDRAVDAVSKGKAGYNEWHSWVSSYEWSRSALPEAGLHLAGADMDRDQPEDALVVLKGVAQLLKQSLEARRYEYPLDLSWGKAACLAGGKPAADVEERLGQAAAWGEKLENLGTHWGFAAPLRDMCAAAEGRLAEGKLITSIHDQVTKMRKEHIDLSVGICEMRDHKAFWLRLGSRAPAFVREWNQECPRDPCGS